MGVVAKLLRDGLLATLLTTRITSEEGRERDLDALTSSGVIIRVLKLDLDLSIGIIVLVIRGTLLVQETVQEGLFVGREVGAIIAVAIRITCGGWSVHGSGTSRHRGLVQHRARHDSSLDGILAADSIEFSIT